MCAQHSKTLYSFCTASKSACSKQSGDGHRIRAERTHREEILTRQVSPNGSIRLSPAVRCMPTGEVTLSLLAVFLGSPGQDPAVGGSNEERQHYRSPQTHLFTYFFS